jgi:transposase
MQLTDRPDHVIRYEPRSCRDCGTRLDGACETGMERRQVTQIPPVRAEVTDQQMIEKQMIEKQCPAAGRAPRQTRRTGWLSSPVQSRPGPLKR